MMNIKVVYQVDSSGMFLCETTADESPLEPGVWHMPARTVEPAPPPKWPDDKWPRWNGANWTLASRPTPPTPEDPVEKLRAFLDANPDVAQYLAPKKVIPEEG
jgi:hypothetical protein